LPPSPRLYASTNRGDCDSIHVVVDISVSSKVELGCQQIFQLSKKNISRLPEIRVLSTYNKTGAYRSSDIDHITRLATWLPTTLMHWSLALDSVVSTN
jgi:hypothetical protein